MLSMLVKDTTTLVFVGIVAAFLLVCLLLKTCARFLPRDAGREFAHDGSLSAGKPRGAGFLFVLAFAAVSILVLPFALENGIYLILLIAAMMTGYLDDGAKTPWGEYKKGLLDLIIAVLVAVTYLNFNPSAIHIELLNTTVQIPAVVYGILTVVLVWVSINVTNCADGVDGLSASVSCVTLGSLYAVMLVKDTAGEFRGTIPVFIACLMAYLLFNATPSILMMGDAGSRAMGLFIAMAVIKTGSPLLYILTAIVLILDGGLGLVKVSLLRFLKIHIMKNIRTPLHDHVRKNMGWSNTQTVTRFTILQALACAIALYFVLV
jgi:phospho-N-acetylmuramoyl-pentapeptide-transferase